MDHTPSTAGTFRKNSGKTPEMRSERFLEFPSRVQLGSPKPYNSRHLKPPEHFQNSLPLTTAGEASFFRSGSGEGLSELVIPVLGTPLLAFSIKKTEPPPPPGTSDSSSPPPAQKKIKNIRNVHQAKVTHLCFCLVRIITPRCP